MCWHRQARCSIRTAQSGASFARSEEGQKSSPSVDGAQRKGQRRMLSSPLGAGASSLQVALPRCSLLVWACLAPDPPSAIRDTPHTLAATKPRAVNWLGRGVGLRLSCLRALPTCSRLSLCKRPIVSAICAPPYSHSVSSAGGALHSRKPELKLTRPSIMRSAWRGLASHVAQPSELRWPKDWVSACLAHPPTRRHLVAG